MDGVYWERRRELQREYEGEHALRVRTYFALQYRVHTDNIERNNASQVCYLRIASPSVLFDHIYFSIRLMFERIKLRVQLEASSNELMLYQADRFMICTYKS